MSQKRFPNWAVTLFAGFLWLWPQATAALVITDARLSLSLQITGPPSGVLLGEAQLVAADYRSAERSSP